MKHFFARSGGRNQIIPGFGLSMGMTLTILSLLILIPLASVLAHSLQLTANDYAKLITNSGIRNAFITSISCSVLAALVNCVFGFILAWVLVRYDFFGKRLLNGVIELPFALLSPASLFPSSIPIRASSAVSLPAMASRSPIPRSA